MIWLFSIDGCTETVGPEQSPTVRASASQSGQQRYIVLFQQETPNPAAVARTIAQANGSEIVHVFEHALKGFSLRNLPPQALDALRRNPNVVSVEPVQILRFSDTQSLPLDSYSYQTSSLWALDRLDQTDANFDGAYTYDYCGAGVHIYIVDSGIRGGHTQWGYGRIGESVTKLFLNWGASPTIDQAGHGTAVAGVAAGSTYGIAKCATIHSVRVNDNGSIYDDDVIAGIDWVVGHRVNPAVINLSIGGVPGSFGLRNALEGAVSSGIVTVKAAGNDNIDAYQDRANRANGLIVAGATTSDDIRSSFSDYGSTISLFAPGSAIFSASNQADNATGTVYGTSFGAPFIVGTAALMLQQDPYASPSRIRDVLIRSAGIGYLGNLVGASPNRLLFSRVHLADYPPPMTYPAAPEISGPSAVRPYSSWLFAASNLTMPEPLSFEWYVNGELQGETSSFFRLAAEGYTVEVELRVVDGSGQSWSNHRYITVSSSASECYDV